MKVVFLDFDGVILTMRTAVACGTNWSSAIADPLLVKTLTRVCEKGVKIVVSSSWRDATEMCHRKLLECDLKQFLHEDWRTKEIKSRQAYSDRPEEIEEWLARHPEVKDYRILDDDAWAWLPKQRPKALMCDSEDGASGRVLLALLEFVGLRKN